MTDHDFTREPDGQPDTAALIGHLTPDEQGRMFFALSVPDLYPARNVATAIGCTAPQVHTWRRARNIRKATS